MSAFLQIMVFLVLTPSVKTTSFNYPKFGSSPKNILFQGDAYASPGGIQLTRNQVDTSLDSSIGRSLYAEPVRLWDSSTGEVADFNTTFSFVIAIPEAKKDNGGDGLAFFLAPNDTVFPSDSGGACLGLFSQTSMCNSSGTPVVTVEVDTYKNVWDPDYDHIGIDVNSVRSVETVEVLKGLKVNATAKVWVSYNSIAKNISVHLIIDEHDVDSTLSHVLDLPKILPEWINVGFSAATGLSAETHTILSWQFDSTEFSFMESISTEPPSPPPSRSPHKGLNSSEPPSSSVHRQDVKFKIDIKVLIGSIVGVSFLLLGLVLLFTVWQRKRRDSKDEEKTILATSSTDDDYESETGPKKFSYSELVCATNNFSDEGKLGQGGFGGVYRGTLNDQRVEVAVKKVSRDSRQGKKEFVAEVQIISKLRHRNLVQLIGWCKERGEYLIVYEFMPNGSLDYHLFGGRSMLTWVLRYKIACGLAAALLYLHEEKEQYVVHRDIKSSNIMLDSSFTAKLGDFGLARLVDHELTGKTTMLAGTLGYMAPECSVTGKVGKESDVYSFGVVALEIACGRRVFETKEEPSKVLLVGWVWELYGNGRVLEAADAKLGFDFDEQQMERLLIVGLWCCNIDTNLRPSIKQAINVLNFDAPLPDLPFKMSMPNYFTTSSVRGTEGIQSQASSSSHNTNSSNSSSAKYSVPR